MIGPHVALDGADRFIRIRDGLTLCRFSDYALAVFLEAYNRRGCTITFRVRDNNGFSAFHDGNARVGCT
jgi:hypothetical protein